MSKQYIPPLLLGTKTEFGEIVAIKFIDGDRYYFCIKDGVVSFLPSDVLEKEKGND